MLTEALGALVPAYTKLKHQHQHQHQQWDDHARHLSEWERDNTLDC